MNVMFVMDFKVCFEFFPKFFNIIVFWFCRYKYKYTPLYKLLEEFVTFIFDCMELRYPNVFLHLRKILEVEGFANGGVSIGKSLFI